jgi:hypothetical protein
MHNEVLEDEDKDNRDAGSEPDPKDAVIMKVDVSYSQGDSNHPIADKGENGSQALLPKPCHYSCHDLR